MNKILYVLLAGLFVFAACTVQTDQNNNQTPPQSNQTGLTADSSPEEVQAYVESWIRNQPTYAYDGQNLTLQDHQVMESYPPQHALTYTFTSTHAGYGDRSDEVVAQVLTDHTIRVVVRDSEVESAIIDDRYNERTQEAMTGEPAQEPGTPTESQETVALRFQPMQCENQVWDEWYANGSVNYVTEPTDEQLIQDYYANAHGIPVQQVEKIQSDQIVCQACNTCPTSYRYELTVQEGFADGGLEQDVFAQHGWE